MSVILGPQRERTVSALGPEAQLGSVGSERRVGDPRQT